MDNVLKDLLKKMDERLNCQENMMQQIIQLVASNNERFNDIDKRFNRIDQHLERIETAVNRIEQNQLADIMSMLKQINSKLDERDNEAQALNK